MRYPAAETAAKHARILEKASRLFRERGFADVSVAEIMQATGLTHGPFYNHFASKEGLMVEAVEHASEEGLAALEAIPRSEQSASATSCRTTSRGSTATVQRTDASLPPASDIAREPAVRSAMRRRNLKAMIAKMASYFPWKSGTSARGETIRTLSCAIGALIRRARSTTHDLSREIFEGSRAVVARMQRSEMRGKPFRRWGFLGLRRGACHRAALRAG